MRANVTGDEIRGYCESRDENDKKAEVLKNQIKAINADSSELTGITAKEFEVKPKDLNAVYKRYKEMVESGDEDTDFFALMALLEEAMEDD